MGEEEKLTMQAIAERKASMRLTFADSRYITRGNTHRKLLVSDDEFVVTTSLNWLAFRGDSRERPRDEYGDVFRKAPQVEKRYQAGLALLDEVYRGAGGAVAARPINVGRKDERHPF